MERPLRVSNLRPHEHKKAGDVPLLPPLGASNGDVPALFTTGEVLTSSVLVSMGTGTAPLGRAAVMLESLAPIVEESGVPVAVKEPSSDNSELAVALDFGAEPSSLQQEGNNG